MLYLLTYTALYAQTNRDLYDFERDVSHGRVARRPSLPRPLRQRIPLHTLRMYMAVCAGTEIFISITAGGERAKSKA